MTRGTYMVPSLLLQEEAARSARVTAPACDGLGGCALEVLRCAPFACDDAGAGCALSCLDDTGCAADAVCADGGCVLRRSLPPTPDPTPLATPPPSAGPAASADPVTPVTPECGCGAPGAGGAALALAAWALRQRRGSRRTRPWGRR